MATTDSQKNFFIAKTFYAFENEEEAKKVAAGQKKGCESLRAIMMEEKVINRPSDFPPWGKLE